MCDVATFSRIRQVLSPSAGAFKDLWMAFDLSCNVVSRNFHVVIWRDVVFRSGPNRMADTSYRLIEFEKRRDFLAKIEELVLPNWKQRKYNDFGVLDGWMWTLTLRRGQRLKHWEGSNAYPGTFREVSALIADLVQLPQLMRDANHAYSPI
jgi:hypothetical protein